MKPNRAAHADARGNRGECTLLLKQDGSLVSGTIQCTNVEQSFGAAPQPIADGKVTGDRLRFTAKGQDGFMFEADFKVKGNDIAGWGTHARPSGSANVEFEFRRK